MASATRSVLVSGALGVVLGAGVIWLNGGQGMPHPAEPGVVEAAPDADVAVVRAAPEAKATVSFDRGRGYVSERLSQGAWTEADREHMRPLLGEMNDQERMELMKQVIVAVNRGQLKVELEGPVF